jgi:hypothetical protein
LRYLNITITIKDPVKSKQASKNKRGKVKTIYKNFTVLQVKEFGTNKDTSGTNNNEKELILEFSDVKFMDGYMDFLNEVSRSYIPIKTIHRIPKVSVKDKRRYFISNICDILSASKRPHIIVKTLEECMTLGDFYYTRWKSEKKRMWKQIESSLIEAKKEGLLVYKWIFREIKECEAEKDGILIDDKGGN